MFISIRMSTLRRAAIGVCCVVLAAVFAWRSVPADTTVFAPQDAAPVTVVVDPGHGGEDGGAVSVTGVPESQINLAIAKRLDALLGFYGENSYLMREEDISLHDSEAKTLREKKVSDLHNRAQLVGELEGAVLVSIHQNTFPQSKYHGTQVFFAPTQGSQALAETCQQAIHTSLQPDNSRQAKPIGDNVYLMNHVDCPAVLVECGFLSNPEEEAMLRQDGYQTKLAAVLAQVCLSS